jgi:hypothetical protein
VRKRESPTEDDFQYTEGALNKMIQSNELKGEPTLTPKLEEITNYMKITDEQGELVDALGELESEEERVDLLAIVIILAMDSE